MWEIVFRPILRSTHGPCICMYTFPLTHSGKKTLDVDWRIAFTLIFNVVTMYPLLWMWFGRSDHNLSSMHLGFIYICIFMWSSTVWLLFDHLRRMFIPSVKGVLFVLAPCGCTMQFLIPCFMPCGVYPHTVWNKNAKYLAFPRNMVTLCFPQC